MRGAQIVARRIFQVFFVFILGIAVCVASGGAWAAGTKAAETRRLYPQVPKVITSPEMVVRAYYDALYYASNPAAPAGFGTISSGLTPYPVAYRYLSKEWQSRVSYDQFLEDWKGTLHVELRKLLPAGTVSAGGELLPRYFVETQNTELVDSPPRTVIAYYAGFVTVKKEGLSWKLYSADLAPEDLVSIPLGGHQSWRADAASVAASELGLFGAGSSGSRVSTNRDGTVTVRFTDAKKTALEATLVQQYNSVWTLLTASRDGVPLQRFVSPDGAFSLMVPAAWEAREASKTDTVFLAAKAPASADESAAGSGEKASSGKAAPNTSGTAVAGVRRLTTPTQTQKGGLKGGRALESLLPSGSRVISRHDLQIGGRELSIFLIQRSTSGSSQPLRVWWEFHGLTPIKDHTYDVWMAVPDESNALNNVYETLQWMLMTFRL